MDEFDTKYGIFVRMLMINVRKSKLTRKMDIREELQVDNQTMNKLIEFTKEKVTLLGFELVGIDKNQIVDPLNADRYYLIRNGNIKDSTKNKDSVLLRRMAAVFNLIIIESGRISLKRLVFLCSKIDIFSKYDIEGFIRFIKKEGYLEIIKEENEYYVVLGWRFNVEYDAEDMINSLQTSI